MATAYDDGYRVLGGAIGNGLSRGAAWLAASPVLLVLIAMSTVQVGSSVAKDLYAHVTPVTVTWLRLTSAALILGLVARPRLTGRRPREWGWLAAYAGAMVGMNVAFYLAIERIPIGMAVTLEFLGPLAVAVAGSRRARDFVWVGLAGAGVALLGFTPGDLDPLGVVYALVAAACWALYIVVAKPLGRSWEGVSGVTGAVLIGAIVMVVPVVLLDAWPPPVAGIWAQGLAVGLLASVIPYGLEIIALRRMAANVFGILMSLEPAFAALAALLILGEQLRPAELIAMACVIAASIGVVRSSTPREPREPADAHS